MKTSFVFSTLPMSLLFAILLASPSIAKTNPSTSSHATKDGVVVIIEAFAGQTPLALPTSIQEEDGRSALPYSLVISASDGTVVYQAVTRDLIHRLPTEYQLVKGSYFLQISTIGFTRTYKVD